MKEICICAALKTKDGLIIRGHRHNDCNETMVRMGLSPFKWSIDTHGFVTSKNRFVTRAEGYKLQVAAGVKSHAPFGYDRSGDLFSEDLY